MCTFLRRKELPVLPKVHNNLDVRMRDLRHFKLANIAKMATEEIQNIKASWQFYFLLCDMKEPRKF